MKSEADAPASRFRCNRRPSRFHNWCDCSRKCLFQGSPVEFRAQEEVLVPRLPCRSWSAGGNARRTRLTTSTISVRVVVWPRLGRCISDREPPRLFKQRVPKVKARSCSFRCPALLHSRVGIPDIAKPAHRNKFKASHRFHSCDFITQFA